MKLYRELEKPIIFIGSARSGTTIFSEIIMRHPDLAYQSNYQEMFYKYPGINILRNLFDNRFWRVFGQKKQLNEVSTFNKYIFKPKEGYQMWKYLSGGEVDFSRDFLANTQVDPERVDFIRDYFYKLVKLQNRKRLTFKITGPSRIAYLTSIFPDAVFINLKRSKLPTINSLLMVDFWESRGMDRLWWKGVYSDEEKAWVEQNSHNPAVLTAFQLKKIDEITEQELNRIQPEYIEVHYENFVENPKGQLQRVIDFTGLKSFDFEKYLSGVKIHNRNKKDSDYFSANDLEAIYKVLGVETSM